jgi:phosphonate transport system substrate-binding protein
MSDAGRGSHRERPAVLPRRPALGLALAGGAAALAAAGCGAGAPTPAGGETPPTLRVGLVPNQAPDRIRAQYQPFGDYLQAALQQPIELFVATDYTGVVEAMASDKLDLAYFGGLTYAQAERRADVAPLVTEVDRETGTKQYYSAVVVRSDGPIRALADLKEPGRKFAFGDINSTSGSLYPRILLDRAGIGSFTDPQRFVYTGGHDATTLAVANGAVDAGGVEKRIMQRLIDAGTVQADQLRIVEQALVMGYPWAVRRRLAPGLTERIAGAFLEMKHPELLTLMRAERYERVSGADYDEVRREGARLGLLR